MHYRYKGLSVFFLLLTGCSHSVLSVEHIYVDRHYLPSTFAATPDPLQKDPPTGQYFYIYWNVPQNQYHEDMLLQVDINYMNLTNQTFSHKIDRKKGYWRLDILDELYRSTGGVFTYKITIDEIEAKLEHQMYKELLTIDQVSMKEAPNLQNDSLISSQN